MTKVILATAIVSKYVYSHKDHVCFSYEKSFCFPFNTEECDFALIHFQSMIDSKCFFYFNVLHPRRNIL